MDGQYKPGDIILGNWTLIQLLGEGSFGRVFEAEREDFGRVYKAAIKIITIPQNQSEIKSVMADGMDKGSITAYFQSFVEELVDEFSLMSSLKGNSNIVSYEDHTVIQHKNDIGWDIIIRMELLTPMLDYTQNTKLRRKDVTQLGIDMCKALELCQKYNIVHRDIKPENIFVSENGDFKLGDFGIARTVEKTTSGLSKKGTYTYMAPEIYRGDAYGSSVDIYSLGIVLYRLLNENRNPFMPEYPAPITHSDREKALAKRISGAQIPKPKNADGRLVEIVLKACAYDPKERYSSPMQMREELEAIQYNKEEAAVIYPLGDETPVKSAEYLMEGVPSNIQSGKPQVTSPEQDGTLGLFGNIPVQPGVTGSPDNVTADADKTASLFSEQAIQPQMSPPAVPQSMQPPLPPPPLQPPQPVAPPRPVYAPPFKPQPVSKPPDKTNKKITIGIISAIAILCVIVVVIIIMALSSREPDNTVITPPVSSPGDGITDSPKPTPENPPDTTPKPDPETPVETTPKPPIADSNLIVLAIGNNSDNQSNLSHWDNVIAISAGGFHSVGLRADGTVIAEGQYSYGEINVSGWRDIIAISAGGVTSYQMVDDGSVFSGGGFTLGLKSDGTVSATGWNDHGQCNVSGWSDIIAVAAGGMHSVGLKSNGTVVAVGRNDRYQCDVSGWSNIVAIAAGIGHTVGLKSDGTVVAVGQDHFYQSDVSGWSDIIAISAADNVTIGLKSNGTVVALGNNSEGQLNVSGWRNIVAIATGGHHTIGLRNDGTLIATGGNVFRQSEVSEWRNMKAVSAGRAHTIGLTTDDWDISSLPQNVPMIGISGGERHLDYDGAYVESIVPGSAAELAGLRVGDLVIELAGIKVRSYDEFNAAKEGLRVGDTTTIKVLRSGREQTFSITFIG